MENARIYRRKLIGDNKLNVWGGSWYNAPDAPECPYCGSHDTLTVGFFLLWDGLCRKCGGHFTECTASRVKK